MPIQQNSLTPNGFSYKIKRVRGDTQIKGDSRAPKMGIHFNTIKGINYRIIKACYFILLQHLLPNCRDVYSVVMDLFLSITRINKKYYKILFDHNDNTKTEYNYYQCNCRYMFDQYKELKGYMRNRMLTLGLFAVVQLYAQELNKLKTFEEIERRVFEIFAQDQVFSKYIISSKEDFKSFEHLAIRLAELKKLNILPADYSLAKEDLGTKKHLTLIDLILKYQHVLALSKNDLILLENKSKELVEKLKTINNKL